MVDAEKNKKQETTNNEVKDNRIEDDDDKRKVKGKNEHEGYNEKTMNKDIKNRNNKS